MLKNNVIKALLLGSAAAISNACTANSGGCETAVFSCNAMAPQPLSLTVCKANDVFFLQQFVFDSTELEAEVPLAAVSKASYHRFKVDEHSLSFSYNGSKVILSEYFSAEFEPVVNTLSVTLQQGEEKHYLECDDSSRSQLKTIENGSYN